MLEAGYAIIGIAHDNDIAGGMASPPLRGPKIERVMKVDIRQEWRDYSPNAKGNFGRMMYRPTYLEWADHRWRGASTQSEYSGG